MARISCVICAYNEAGRIQDILRVAVGHPDLLEVIVVNDGSTDGTEDVLRAQKDITLISYPVNKGKTFALSEGISAARGELVMLLDADLSGVTEQDLTDLARPVLIGAADVTISLRRNSLRIYRLLGLDFVSGERVIPRSLLVDAVQAMQELPRWGGEVFMNDYIVKRKKRLMVVRWQNVYNVRKHEKMGLVQGIAEELRMISDACSVLGWYGAVMQIFSLLLLKVSPKALLAYEISNGSSTLPSI